MGASLTNIAKVKFPMGNFVSGNPFKNKMSEHIHEPKFFDAYASAYTKIKDIRPAVLLIES